METISRYLEKRSMKGNALKQLDAFIDLRRDHTTLLEDSLTGDFGRAHGDYNIAHHQAVGCIQFLDAMMRGDTQLQALLKQARQIKRDGEPKPSPT